MRKRPGRLFLHRLAIELHLPLSVIENLPASEIQSWKIYFSILNEDAKTNNNGQAIKPQKPANEPLSPDAEMARWINHLKL